MPQPPTLPPIADAPLSVILRLTRPEPRLEALMAEWVTFLNGLDRDYEILLADDGTPLPTASVAAILPARYPRVQHLRHDEPRGEGAALRTALTAARQPLVF